MILGLRLDSIERAFCMKFVRSDLSPSTFEQSVIDHDAACQWFSERIKPALAAISIDNMPEIKSSELIKAFPPMNRDGNVEKIRLQLVDLIEDYGHVRRKYLAAKDATEVSFLEQSVKILRCLSLSR